MILMTSRGSASTGQAEVTCPQAPGERDGVGFDSLSLLCPRVELPDARAGVLTKRPLPK